jgi:uncharacterized MnhB-related membrane protein
MMLEIFAASVCVLSCIAVFSKDMIKAVLFLAISDIALAVVFYLLLAPDIAITQASVVTALSTIMLVIGIKKTGRME